MPEGGGNFWWEREIPSLYRLIAEIDTQLSKMGGKQRSNATGIQSVLLERLQKALAAEQAHYSLKGLAGTDPTIDKRLAELESPSNESPLAESPRAIKPLLLPTDTFESWRDIEILFLSEERVEVRVKGDSRKTFNYEELGFADQRSGKQNLAWILLAQLAKNKGILPIPQPAKETGKRRSQVQKQIQALRKALRQLFDIHSDPIGNNGSTYATRFKISCKPSFDT